MDTQNNFKFFVLYHNSEFLDLIAPPICNFSELSIYTDISVSYALFTPHPSGFSISGLTILRVLDFVHHLLLEIF